MFIENILGTESKVKIIRTLLDINTAFTLENLEKETGLSRGIIHREVKRLEKVNIIEKVEKQGKLGFYKINLDNSYVHSLANIFDLEKMKERRNKIPVQTWNILESLVNSIISSKIDVGMIILFGSVARGTSTLKSDIDILVVQKGKIERKKDLKEGEILNNIIEKMSEVLKRKVNIISMFTMEYMHKKTDLIKEIKREGIILYGRESFLFGNKELGDAVFG